MATHVIMPQLGESVTEGTVGRWLVAEGQPVKQYDPLLQVTTDKVDTEISAPATGVLLRIYVPEDRTVARGTVLALIGAPGEVAPDLPPAAEDEAHGGASIEVQAPPESPSIRPVAPAVSPVTPVAQRVALEHGLDVTQMQGSGPSGRVTKEDEEAYLARREEGAARGPAPELPERATASATLAASSATPSPASGFISPAVARLAAEHSVDLRQITGTGEGGRVTKKDVQQYLETGRAAAPVQAPAELPAWEQPGTGSLFKPTEEIFGTGEGTGTGQESAAPAAQPATAPRPPLSRPASTSGALADAEARPLTAMRRSIARHMVLSKHTSAHVTTVMEADLTRVVQARERLQEIYARQGARLTYTPFLIQAIVAGLQAVPEANSSFEEDHLALHRQMHIGVAVALPEGLIVPVIRDGGEKSLLGLARAVNDLAERARAHRLSPDDVQGGTFTLTNHGTSGSLLATPIINQPQAGILGVGAIQKRAVVISQGSSLLPGPGDTLAIRPMV